MSKPNAPLPAAVDGMLENLYNENLAPHVRENYRLMLENIRDQVSEALSRYNIERYSKKKVSW